MSNDIKTASVLAFERKLDPSDALLHAGDWASRNNSAQWAAVHVREKSVRGTPSHRFKAKGGADVAKQDMKPESPNPQLVDNAALPAEADTLKMQFTLRVLGGAGEPSTCNDLAYGAKLRATVATYVHAQGFSELSHRYAANLANGRFLWRNRIGAEQVEVQVAHMRDGKAVKTWTFDALGHSLRDLVVPERDMASVGELADVITQGLSGKTHVLLQITAFARIGPGQEVFPSQELILERGRGDKSKTLYKIGEGMDAIAAIHSQKIGNALRTVDTWYPGASENGPIAVEPYGSVTTQGKAWRQPKEKQDFYSLLDAWVVKDKAPDLPQQHFVIATLIRGGVFGEAG